MTVLPQVGATHASLTDAIASAVRELIISGQLEPGQPLRERQLAEQLAVSRIPLRESLIELSHEGFVDAIPRRGAFVSEVTPTSVAELFDIREALEGLAASLAASRHTPQDLIALRTAIEREHAPGGPEAVAADTAFHDALIEAAHQTRLGTMMAPIQGHVRRIFFLTSRRLPVVMADEHSAVVDRIEAGDAKGARRAAEGHVRSVRRATLAFIQAAAEDDS